MTYLYYSLGIVLLVLVYASFEATWLQVNVVRFTKDKNALKILHLTDIHINRLKVDPSKVKRVIDSESPDIIILTGDYVEKASQTKDFFNFLDHILENNTRSIYFCLGNHDYEAFEKYPKDQEHFIKEMEYRGCIALHNSSVVIEKNLKSYNIIGIADMRYNNHDFSTVDRFGLLLILNSQFLGMKNSVKWV
ncbi:MAG: metallophosphoesterase [Clostridiales bacterium]|nr:metallophosphoesterase [Clostridiales bacterium]